jgi:hypothetical protein
MGLVAAWSAMRAAPVSAQLPDTHPDAFGVRSGAVTNLDYPGLHPLFQPYYEAAAGPADRPRSLVLTGDLTLAFDDLATIVDRGRLTDFGFHGGVRWIPREPLLFPASVGAEYWTASVGFDVYPDDPFPGRASMTLPLSFGVANAIGRGIELETGVLLAPLHYLRQGWGITYGITIGLRFISSGNE